MSIREEIKLKIINDLARELARQLNRAESDIPSLLNLEAVRSQIDLKAEMFLERFHEKVLIDDIQNHINRLENVLNGIRDQINSDLKNELEILNRSIAISRIESEINISNVTLEEKDRVEYIKNLIANNNTEEAISILLQNTKSTDKYNEVVIHFSKLKRLSSECRMGTITRGDETQERVKINTALLSFIDSEL